MLAGLLPAAACAAPAPAPQPGSATVTLSLISQSGEPVEAGTVAFRDTAWGVLVEPQLHGLAVGPHAAHVHVNPDCGSMSHGDHFMPAAAAGDHYDPGGTGVHAGPYGAGHLGDLPNLLVEADGEAKIPVLAPRLKAADLRGRALIIHAGADRYSGQAAHGHGSGGARMYCGVIR
ncbi:MAG: superoxide dismutase family protein [Sphingomonadales bacterium]|nr:superoxide dismutase family protein [Sphingomonadales bacterium]